MATLIKMEQLLSRAYWRKRNCKNRCAVRCIYVHAKKYWIKPVTWMNPSLCTEKILICLTESLKPGIPYTIFQPPTSSITKENPHENPPQLYSDFYEAMLIFTEKHPEFSGQKLLIKIAIYFHGLLQLLRQTIAKWWPVAMDAVIFIASFYLVSKLWALYNFGEANWFRSSFITSTFLFTQPQCFCPFI